MTVIDAAGTGDVEVNLDNAGEFELDYINTSGDSVIENLEIHSEGDNHIDDLRRCRNPETVDGRR